MRKLLALFCAASGLLFTPAANAQSTYGTRFSGTVPAFCAVASAAISSGQIAPLTQTATTTNATVLWGSNFNDSQGRILQVTGDVVLTVNANSNCSYTLTATNGSVLGVASHGQLAYSAGIAQGQAGSVSNPTQCICATNTILGQVAIGTPQLSTQAQYIDVGFTINATSSAVLRDNYRETLVLTIVAS